MSRTRRSTRRPSHLSTTAAVILFLVFALCLGGVAATLPALNGIVGVALVVLGVALWIASGNNHGRSRPRRRRYRLY